MEASRRSPSPGRNANPASKSPDSPPPRNAAGRAAAQAAAPGKGNGSTKSPAKSPDLLEESKEGVDPAQTFLTQRKEDDHSHGQPWTINDLLFPGGKIAKLVKVPNPRSRDLKLGDVLKRCGVNEPLPVIMLSGTEGDARSKLLVGVVRAAFSTDAVIVDNGLKSGIELACSRKKVRLMGVCPESLIHYPTKVSTGERSGELAAGHSHLFVVGRAEDNMRWDSVVPFKLDVIERLRKGRGGPDCYVCRAVCVVVGDSDASLWEVEKALKNQWPVIVFENSPVGAEIAKLLKGSSATLPAPLQEELKAGKVFMFPADGTAEHLASAIHFHLSVSV